MVFMTKFPHDPAACIVLVGYCQIGRAQAGYMCRTLTLVLYLHAEMTEHETESRFGLRNMKIQTKTQAEKNEPRHKLEAETYDKRLVLVSLIYDWHKVH